VLEIEDTPLSNSDSLLVASVGFDQLLAGGDMRFEDVTFRFRDGCHRVIVLTR
jgi:hypothetical protein